jgi:hypothetical protein
MSSLSRGTRSRSIADHFREHAGSSEQFSGDCDRFHGSFEKPSGHLEETPQSFRRAAAGFERADDDFAAGDANHCAAARRCESAHGRSDAFYDHFARSYSSSNRDYCYIDCFNGRAEKVSGHSGLADDRIAELYARVRPPNHSQTLVRG